MKRIIFLFAAFSAALACTKEAELTTIDGNNEIKIVARIVDRSTPLVKTDYDESTGSPKFSWLASDLIAVQLENRNTGSNDQWKFSADAAGASTTFTALTPDKLNITETWKLATYAFYPKHDADSPSSGSRHRDLVYTAGSAIITLYDESVVAESELKTLVPLIGIRSTESVGEKASVTYDFKTATGIIRLSLKNVPATAKKVKLTSASATDYLAGSIPLENIADSEISMSDITSNQSASKTITFDFTPTEGQDLVVYMPIPTGTLNGGFTVAVLGEEDAEIISRKVSQDVVIERNKVYFVPDITFDSEWTSIGTGWFGDNFLFYQSSFGKAGCMAPVNVQQNKTNPNKYRIRDPYGSAASYLGVSLGGFHNAYLTFTIDGDTITYEDHKTGIQFSNATYSNCNTKLYQDGSTYDKVYYDSTNPKLVTLSPNYKMENISGSKNYSVTLSGTRKNCANIINIVFPGFSVAEAIVGSWTIGGDTMTIGLVSNDAEYNLAITHYNCPDKSLDIDGTCKGLYSPASGTIVFPQLQPFADTGDKWTGSTNTGSDIYYSFRGKNSGASVNLGFYINNANGYWNPSVDTYCFDRWVVDYGNSSGYLSFRQLTASSLNLVKQ